MGASIDDRGDAGERGAVEMLERSHRRLEERLDALAAAAAALAREAPGDHVAVVDDVLDFLERSATRHEVDEEGSLFPRLRRHPAIGPLLDALTAEHLQHRALHLRLRAERRDWPPEPDAHDGRALVELVAELRDAYRRHIEREEAELLPFAREHLTPDELTAVLQEMDERRGRGGGGGRER